MNVPKGCKHRGRFKKDCCEVLWNGVIIEHDGCVVSNKTGCDLVAYDEHKIFFIEIKEGKISSKDATKIVEQIKACEDYYSTFIGHRERHRVFLHCIGKKKKKKRPDDFVREKLKRARIEYYNCHSIFNLNELYD
jgi:hypothetical protein